MNVFLIDYKEQIFKFCQVNGREGIGLKVRGKSLFRFFRLKKKISMKGNIRNFRDFNSQLYTRVDAYACVKS